MSEHCAIKIEIPIQDENCPPENHMSPINGLWKMTSTLGKKRPSQEPVSPTSQPPEAKRLCEDPGRKSFFGRLGQALWTAGGTVAYAAGALSSLAKFHSRRGDFEAAATNLESSKSEASDVVVLNIDPLPEQKEEAVGLCSKTDFQIEAEGQAPLEGRTFSSSPGKEPTVSPATGGAAILAPLASQVSSPTPLASQVGAFPEVVRGGDLECEYQQLLMEIAQSQEIAQVEIANGIIHSAPYTPEPSNLGLDCEAHIHAMNQISDPQFTQEEEHQQTERIETVYETQAPNSESDQVCLVSINPVPGHPQCESGQYCQGSATDELFEDGGDFGHYYCGPCFEAAGV